MYISIYNLQGCKHCVPKSRYRVKSMKFITVDYMDTHTH